MMETVIFVLKMIGIVLALLLAAVLLLLFLALFCRVRYDVAVDAGESITGKARFRWLWFVVRFSAVYDDGDMSWVLRVLGIPIKRQRPAGVEGKTKRQKENPQFRGELMENEKETGERVVSEEEDHGQETEQNRITRRLAKFFAKIQGFLLKIRDISDTIRNIGKRVTEFIKDLPELLQNIKDKKDAVITFLRDKHVRAFLRLSKTQLGYLLVHLKPKKVQGFIRFGTGNPCSTGQALGAAAMAYPLYASWLRIVPEFEEKHFSGYLKARGKIQLFRVILIGKRWFLADTSKRCLNKWNKLKEELTNGR